MFFLPVGMMNATACINKEDDREPRDKDKASSEDKIRSLVLRMARNDDSVTQYDHRNSVRRDGGGGDGDGDDDTVVLSVDEMRLLATGLCRDRHLQRLSLRASSLDDRHIAYLAESLRTNTVLRVLDLSSNKGISNQGAEYLASALGASSKSSSSSSVSVSPPSKRSQPGVSNPPDTPRGTSTSSCNHSLAILDLRGTSIGKEGIRAMSSMLLDNYSLTDIELPLLSAEEDSQSSGQSVLELIEDLLNRNRAFVGLPQRRRQSRSKGTQKRKEKDDKRLNHPVVSTSVSISSDDDDEHYSHSSNGIVFTLMRMGRKLLNDAYHSFRDVASTFVNCKLESTTMDAVSTRREKRRGKGEADGEHDDEEYDDSAFWTEAAQCAQANSKQKHSIHPASLLLPSSAVCNSVSSVLQCSDTGDSRLGATPSRNARNVRGYDRDYRHDFVNPLDIDEWTSTLAVDCWRDENGEYYDDDDTSRGDSRSRNRNSRRRRGSTRKSSSSRGAGTSERSGDRPSTRTRKDTASVQGSVGRKRRNREKRDSFSLSKWSASSKDPRRKNKKPSESSQFPTRQHQGGNRSNERSPTKRRYKNRSHDDDSSVASEKGKNKRNPSFLGPVWEGVLG